MSLDRFQLVADWYHFALLEMIALRGFSSKPEDLARRLCVPVHPLELERAMDRLQRQKLLVRDAEGGLSRGLGEPVTKDEVPSEAVKRHHVQMLAIAKKALYEQPVERRDFRGTKLALKREHYEAAKEIIRNCHRELQKLGAQSEADAVYALNTQFFSLTD
jgi:uncharacterized protein (TIGR02147 family)